MTTKTAIVVAGIAVIALAAFLSYQKPQILDSGVDGIVLLGPTCPVEHEGGASCNDRPYQTSIDIVSHNVTSRGIITVQLNTNGELRALLSPGAYTLQAHEGAVLPRCGSLETTIRAHEFEHIIINCDTGIR